MSVRVFISYGHDDTAASAGRLHDRLKTEFGADTLFMDVDGIPLGSNFVTVIGAEVAKCTVLLAVMGPQWLRAKDNSWVRRLDNPNDFVLFRLSGVPDDYDLIRHRFFDKRPPPTKNCRGFLSVGE